MTAARPDTCRIKCCGLMRPEDVDAANRARPDYAGFIVDFPKSHRNVTPTQARQLAARLDADIRPVAVFVDRPAQDVAAAAAEIGAWAVQLHGSEDEAYVAKLRTLTGCRIWQAFTVRGEDDLARAAQSSADLLLLDAGTGSGRTFDWELAARFAQTQGRPFLLAGGLTPRNIPLAIQRVHPFGVDISSGIETDKRKDPAKIAAAVAAAHGANREAAATHLGASTGPWRPDGSR